MKPGGYVSAIVFFLIAVIVFASAICLYIWREQTAYDTQMRRIHDLEIEMQSRQLENHELKQRLGEINKSCMEWESHRQDWISDIIQLKSRTNYLYEQAGQPRTIRVTEPLAVRIITPEKKKQNLKRARAKK